MSVRKEIKYFLESVGDRPLELVEFATILSLSELGECWVWISGDRCLYDRSHLRYESDLTETEWNEVGRQ